MNYAQMSKKKYLFYILIHPVTGFEELKYNRKGSLLYANILCALFTLANIIRAVVPSFLFRTGKIEDVNIFWIIIGCVGGLFLFTVANWMFCTLLDGKGKFRDLWIAVCYALLPYTALSIPLTLVGHLFTLDEAVFYYTFHSVLLFWSVCLAFIGIMVMQQFSIPKNILTIIFSLIGILIILFLLLLLFSLFQNVYIFIMTLINEISFRI